MTIHLKSTVHVHEVWCAWSGTRAPEAELDSSCA